MNPTDRRQWQIIHTLRRGEGWQNAGPELLWECARYFTADDWTPYTGQPPIMPSPSADEVKDALVVLFGTLDPEEYRQRRARELAESNAYARRQLAELGYAIEHHATDQEEHRLLVAVLQARQ